MNITITLTEDQAQSLNNWLSYGAGWIQNNDYPKSDKRNAFVERIRQKIVRAQLKQSHSSSARTINEKMRKLAKAKIR